MADTKISALTASTVPLAGTEVLPIVQGGVTKQVSVANLTAGRDTAVNTLSSTAGVWVGTTAAVYSELANILSGANSPAYYLIRNTNAGSSAYTGYYLNASGNAWAMRMGSSAANSNALEWVIDSVGAPVVRWSMTTDGNLIQGTAAKGVNFTANTPAAGKTSQLLNAYEEGTWTPVVKVNNAGSAIGITSYEATYTRVGRLVFAQFRIARNDATALSGNVTWSLPIASGNTTYFVSGSWWNATTNISGTVDINNYANSIANGGIAAGGYLAFTNFANGDNLCVSMVYQA